MSKNLIYIIKAQISYSCTALKSTILMLIGMFLYAYFREFNPLNLVCFLLYVQYVSIVLINNAKENRDYTIRLLTLTSKEIALSRIILILVGFTIIYFAAFLLHILVFQNTLGFRDSIQELFMFGAIAMFNQFLYLILTDYFSIFKKKSYFTWFNVFIFLVLGIIFFAIIITIDNVYRSSISSANFLIILLYPLTIIFSFISYFSFQQKESFLGHK